MLTPRMRAAWHRYFEKLSSREHSAHQVAIGFAIGTAIGLLPTFGVGFLVGVVVLFLYPRMGKLSLFGALALWNPFVLFPFQAASLWLGRLLFGEPFLQTSRNELLSIMTFHGARDIVLHYLVGNLFVTALGTVVAYFAARGVVDAYRSRRAKKGLKGRT